ncbi:MAG TPA: hypothetical protein VJZ02_00475, partial [Candidatus Brocadiales bacterium]|nr:hypothetical protein [Candidatus Brocadiales bacterium]
TLALFGPTSPAVWGPRGERAEIVQGRVECSPCGPEARNLCQRSNCMETISTAQVIETAERLMGAFLFRM